MLDPIETIKEEVEPEKPLADPLPADPAPADRNYTLHLASSLFYQI